MRLKKTRRIRDCHASKPPVISFDTCGLRRCFPATLRPRANSNYSPVYFGTSTRQARKIFCNTALQLIRRQMQRLRPNTTLELLRQGKAALGTWLQLGSYSATRLLAGQGCFDWMLLDLEHNPIDNQQATINLSVISDISQGKITPIARVISGTVHHIKRALDCGAQGVLVPMVNTKKDAEDVVKWSRYPPVGERGAGGLDAHLGFGVNRPSYIAQCNKNILVAIQIETQEAVDNIEEIASVEGIDVIFIGPNDLHLSMGLPAKFWSDEKKFIEGIDKVKSACKKRNIPLGIICRDHQNARDRIKDGFTFVALGSDCHFMLTFAGMETGALKQIPEPEETWCNMVRLQSKL